MMIDIKKSIVLGLAGLSFVSTTKAAPPKEVAPHLAGSQIELEAVNSLEAGIAALHRPALQPHCKTIDAAPPRVLVCLNGICRLDSPRHTHMQTHAADSSQRNQPSPSITPITDALLLHLSNRAPKFLQYGDGKHKIYQFSDQYGVVAPFILGRQAPNMMNHEEATKFCQEKGGRLPTQKELTVILEAWKNSSYNPEAIEELENSTLLSSDYSDNDSQKIHVLIGAWHDLGTEPSHDLFDVRCVYSAPPA